MAGDLIPSLPQATAPAKAVAALLPDGRLHLQHGPIDIIAQGFGPPRTVSEAHRRAAARFSTVLAELVAELPELRRMGGMPRGPVGQRMLAAVNPHWPLFLTPMAAVAGAVAEEVLAALAIPGLRRAYVNNGGDIALALAPGESLTCALAASPRDRVTIRHGDPVRGIATSGWRGRSFSLGIADAVTVLARTAALADAAATVIANAVDLPGHPGIRRLPASALRSDSDLGDLPVTVEVMPLSAEDRANALCAGLNAAEALCRRGLIEGAALFLQGKKMTTGALALHDGGGA